VIEWPIDPRNPGEVFACCGIAHLAWRRDRRVETGFRVSEQGWHFSAPRTVFDQLGALQLTPTDHGLRLGDIDLDWWQPWGLNPEFKFWAGQQSASSVHRNLRQAAADATIEDWQRHAAPTTGRLNVDIQGTWNALALGWSLNEHKGVEMLCRPWLELLASLGFQAFKVSGGKRDGFRYHLWRPAPLPAAMSAFQGRGPGVYSTAEFTVQTGKLGSNTLLLTASPAD